MPWTRKEKIFCITYLETKSFKTAQAKLSPEKPNLSLGSQISSHRVSKQPQQEGRKSQIRQEVYLKMS